jgi:cathepsin F
MSEMNNKYEIFVNNLDKTHNISEAKNKTLGTTKFMDLSPEEFKRKYLTLNFSAGFISKKNITKKYFDGDKKIAGGDKNLRFLQSRRVPAHFDWRLKGAVNEVQTQGQCGGCWAFSTTANLEGLYFIKYGTLPKFSEQQMIDCDGSNAGCGGGIMGSAFEYLQTSGIQQSDSYPYIDGQGYCSYDPSQATSLVSDWTMAGTDDEESIKEMLYNVGPLAVTINAEPLQYYTGGVLELDSYSCPYAPNHGVNIVGYGTDPYGTDYWIVRNTWGYDWGENGYFRLARGTGACGINQYVSSAILN